MVGTRRLELLTSAVSTPEFEINRCIYKGPWSLPKVLLTTEVQLIVTLRCPRKCLLCPFFTISQLSPPPAGTIVICAAHRGLTLFIGFVYRFVKRSNNLRGRVAYFHSGTGTDGQGSACVINTLPDRVQSHNRQAATEYSSSSPSMLGFREKETRDEFLALIRARHSTL